MNKAIVGCLLLLALFGPARAQEEDSERIDVMYDYQGHLLCKTYALSGAYDFIEALREGKSRDEAVAAAGPGCHIEESIYLVATRRIGEPQPMVRKGIRTTMGVFYATEVETEQKWLLVCATELEQNI